MKVAYQQFALPLRHPFRISRGVVSVQETFVVQLAQGGEYGYGEATTNAYYGATIESMSAAVESVRPILMRAELEEPTAIVAELARHLSVQSFALAALDEAIHDLWGKLRGEPVYRLWGLAAENLVPSCFTLGIDTPERMVEKLHEAAGWPIYKIKLGTADDLGIVRELRRHTEVPFRVDANCGWTAEQAIALAPELRDLGVEFIEQPLPAADREGARRVFAESALPIIADESCVTEADVDRCADLFHGINIKLVKCGGLAAARRMIERARQLGLQVMIGCMTESTVGISALAQLLPLVDYADMDGAALLASDIASGVCVESGQCVFSAQPGTGVRLLAGPI
jgi:L-alanine-DL-glutamate epimerase-like enolase superfamily enzyme